jgi:hypothetical protein
LGFGSISWILPSQHWDRTVEAALRDCSGLLLVLSPRSVASENVLDEVGIAIDSGKRVIPVLYEKCTVPMRLTRIQFIDATGDYAGALARCKAAISGISGGREAAIPPAAAAPVPPPEPRVQLAAEIVDRAIAHLTPLVGPIAPVLGQKAAAQAASEAELYSQLGASIPNAQEREAFLQRAGAATPSAPPAPERPSVGDFNATFLDQVVGVLVHYLGPMARHIVVREQQFAIDRESLYQKLADRVPHDRERNELLRKLRAL